MPVNGMIEVPARQFDIGSFDNCTKNKDLRFSFSSDVRDKTRIFTCAEEGRNEVEIWVTDEHGNQDYCLTYLDIQDNRGTCPDTTNIISGNITTPNGNAIPNAAVYFEHSLLVDGTHDMTDIEGNYALERLELMEGDSFMVAPVSDWKPRLGVTAFDLYLLQLHIIQLAPFTDGMQYVAADINNDERINNDDFQALKAIVLRNTDQFPNNHSWRFIDKTYHFNSMDSIFPFPEIRYANVPSDIAERMDFTGIKVGDIDYSVEPAEASMRTDLSMTITLRDRMLGPNESKLSLPLSEEYAYSAMELYLDHDQISVEGMRGRPFRDAYIQNNRIVALNNGKASIKGGELEIDLEIDAEILLSNLLQADNAELVLFDKNGNAYQVKFRFETEVKEYTFNAYPNPFTSNLKLDVELPEASDYTVVIYDVMGKKVYENQMNFDKGHQSVRLDLTNLTVSGMYTLRIFDGDQKVFTKRLLKE
jgi:hypothetical protein